MDTILCESLELLLHTLGASTRRKGIEEESESSFFRTFVAKMELRHSIAANVCNSRWKSKCFRTSE